MSLLTHMSVLVVICLIALQFSDAIASYPVLKNSLDKASVEMRFLANAIGVGPALITTKVVLVAVIVALYMLTSLPLWLWLAAIAYYLYRTGKWVVIKTLLNKYVNG